MSLSIKFNRKFLVYKTSLNVDFTVFYIIFGLEDYY